MNTKRFSGTTFFDLNIDDVEGLLADPDDEPIDLLAKETVARRLRVAKVWNKLVSLPFILLLLLRLPSFLCLVISDVTY